MWIATEDDDVRCAHVGGVVRTRAGQRWVRVDGHCVMVRSDLPGSSISGCPMVGPTTRPCMSALVMASGFSPLLSIEGHSVALSSLVGLTDGVPPGSVQYSVKRSAQTWVGER